MPFQHTLVYSVRGLIDYFCCLERREFLEADAEPDTVSGISACTNGDYVEENRTARPGQLNLDSRELRRGSGSGRVHVGYSDDGQDPALQSVDLSG